MENIEFEAVQIEQIEIAPTEQATEQKKKGRGRPKKEAAAETPQIKKEAVKIDVDKELDELNNQYAIIEAPQQAEAPQRVLVSGLMLLIVCDAFFPAIISKILSKRGKKIDTKKLKLTTEEKKELRETADEAAKFMFANANPIALFFIGLGSIYISKAVEYAEDK
jgi:hypothetical protein